MTDTHEFATRSSLVRRAIAAHRTWIEEKLGVSMSDTVIVDGLPNLSQVGVQKYLGISDLRRTGNRESRRLRPLIAQAEVPPQYPPLLAITEDVRTDLSLEALLEDHVTAWTGFEWKDCPLALRLHRFDINIVILNVSYHSGPGSSGESTARLLVARRDSVTPLLRLFEDIYHRERTPRLYTVGGGSRRVAPVQWNDLIIDANITNLLKNDFETFWQREKWFRKRNLPFRRGYLFHGPPGNGKTSATRAMITSRGLNAHTIRFFDPSVEDSDLDRLFEKADRDRPAMILFEDIDRAFPRSGELASKVSLQHLLNCLDGVATSEGIVVVATANEPALLDPAILRRPGRFDRVVHFPDPNACLRLEYFRRMSTALTNDGLRRPVEASEGFSFAQLRESYITAGQLAFERRGEVMEEDLLAGIRSLRTSMTSGSRRSTAVGFDSCGKAH